MDDLITLVSDGLVCLSDHGGNIDPATFQGLYFRDLRLLSRYELSAPGSSCCVPTGDSAYSACQVYAAAKDETGPPTALLRRRRSVGAQLIDDYRLEVYDGLVTQVPLALRIEVDFLPALKDAAPRPAAPLTRVAQGWHVGHGRYGAHIEIDGPPPQVNAGAFSWTLEADYQRPFEMTVVVRPYEDELPPCAGGHP